MNAILRNVLHSGGLHASEPGRDERDMRGGTDIPVMFIRKSAVHLFLTLAASQKLEVTPDWITMQATL